MERIQQSTTETCTKCGHRYFIVQERHKRMFCSIDCEKSFNKMQLIFNQHFSRNKHNDIHNKLQNQKSSYITEVSIRSISVALEAKYRVAVKSISDKGEIE